MLLQGTLWDYGPGNVSFIRFIVDALLVNSRQFQDRSNKLEVNNRLPRDADIVMVRVCDKRGCFKENRKYKAATVVNNQNEIVVCFGFHDEVGAPGEFIAHRAHRKQTEK